jgi:hypothetical protein
MTTTAPSTVLATIQPAFTDAERLALAAVHHRRVLQYAAEEELLDHSRPHTSGGCGWIMSLVPSRWTATASARCWWPPGSAHLPSMR